MDHFDAAAASLTTPGWGVNVATTRTSPSAGPSILLYRTPQRGDGQMVLSAGRKRVLWCRNRSG